MTRLLAAVALVGALVVGFLLGTAYSPDVTPSAAPTSRLHLSVPGLMSPDELEFLVLDATHSVVSVRHGAEDRFVDPDLDAAIGQPEPDSIALTWVEPGCARLAVLAVRETEGVLVLTLNHYPDPWPRGCSLAATPFGITLELDAPRPLETIRLMDIPSRPSSSETGG